MFQRCWNDALSSQNEKFYGKNRFRFWSLCQPNLSAIALSRPAPKAVPQRLLAGHPPAA
jgi:hypothetical protein